MDVKYLCNNNKVAGIKFTAWQMYKDNQNEIIHLLLIPGEEMPMHTNDFDVVFYVLEGTGYLQTEIEKKEIYVDGCVAVEKGINRCWLNKSDKNLRILVVKKF